jgi:hypothetical protein
MRLRADVAPVDGARFPNPNKTIQKFVNVFSRVCARLRHRGRRERLLAAAGGGSGDWSAIGVLQRDVASDSQAYCGFGTLRDGWYHLQLFDDARRGAWHATTVRF